MAAALLSLALSLALLAAGGRACSLPPRGCTAGSCNLLDSNGFGKSPPYFNGATNSGNKLIGKYYGLWNEAAGNKTAVSSQFGGPIINFEVVKDIGTGPEAGFLISAEGGITTIGDCCKKCAQTDGCLVFLFYQSGTVRLIQTATANATKTPNGFVAGKQCYLLRGGSVSEPSPPGYPVSSPYTGPHSYQINKAPYTSNGTYAYPPAWIGGRCNPGENIKDDPHFVGKYGTRYDFNGEIDKVFMLISDERLHVNVKLGGYEDTRTYGATKLRNGKALRTWIKEIGILWLDSEGNQHTLHVTARTGKEQEMKEGFLARLAYNGAEYAVPGFGEAITVKGLTLKHVSAEKMGPYDLETFSLEIQGLLKLRLQMRPAHPLLQTPMDAYVHFNINIDSLEASPKVHGVLGQTYRKTTTQFLRALEYQMLTKLLGHPVAADGASGLGFLDGQTKDYVVPEILSTKCKFSSF